jgi:hypothetical protein
MKSYIIEMNRFVFCKNYSYGPQNSIFFHSFGPSSLIISIGYRVLISFLWVIGSSDCSLKYHFGSTMLEYGEEKLYLPVFLQLAFLMISPLWSSLINDLFKLKFTSSFKQSNNLRPLLKIDGQASSLKVAKTVKALVTQRTLNVLRHFLDIYLGQF